MRLLNILPIYNYQNFPIIDADSHLNIRKTHLFKNWGYDVLNNIKYSLRTAHCIDASLTWTVPCGEYHYTCSPYILKHIPAVTRNDNAYLLSEYLNQQSKPVFLH